MVDIGQNPMFAARDKQVTVTINGQTVFDAKCNEFEMSFLTKMIENLSKNE